MRRRHCVVEILVGTGGLDINCNPKKQEVMRRTKKYPESWFIFLVSVGNTILVEFFSFFSPLTNLPLHIYQSLFPSTSFNFYFLFFFSFRGKRTGGGDSARGHQADGHAMKHHLAAQRVGQASQRKLGGNIESMHFPPT